MQEIPFEPPVTGDVHIQLLGGFAVTVGDTAVREAQWKSRRARSLVKLLALAPGHRLHRDQIIDSLWPESDLPAAANNFHQTLYTARKVLEALKSVFLTLEEGFLTLSVREEKALSVDVDLFEAAVVQAKKGQDPARYEAALALYPGDLLPEDLYEDWTIQKREALRQVHLNLLLNLARLQETRQEYPAAIDTLRRLLGHDRAHEPAHVGLMRLYALSGQRQQALRQYQTLCEVLQAELEADPSEQSTRLYEAIQAGQFAPAPSLSPPPPAYRPVHNLPAQLTSFIGREKQIGEVGRLVLNQRLVTLTGPGGTGKTRLALKVAEGLLEHFPDGVFLVELAALTDPERVTLTCVRTLDVIERYQGSPIQDLIQYLEKKNFLLILDNCEHVIDACTYLVDGLLKACPSLHVLATSREILSVPGENPYRVPSLAVPDLESQPSLTDVAQSEGVRLFIERARQVSPGLSLNEDNAGSVSLICHRLDGIPLAIELAAARTRMMTIEQIAARLDNAFSLLTGGSRAVLPRQQTLKAMIDWSYNLLSPQERLLLQRLSVFAGGWTLKAAEAVCADVADESIPLEVRLTSMEMLDLLAQLVDKSLVSVETGEEEARYRILEIIRQYARERLLEAAGSARMRDQHLAYFADLSGQAEPYLRGKGMEQWLNLFDAELDNVRAALEWGLVENVGQGLKLATDLLHFWNLRSLFVEGSQWLRKLLDAEAAERGKEPLVNEQALKRIRGLRAYEFLYSFISPRSDTNKLEENEERIAILRRLGPLGRRELGIHLSHIIPLLTDISLAQALTVEMLDIFQQENMHFNLSEYLFWKGQTAIFLSNDISQAELYTEKSLAISREIQDLDGICSRANNLGLYAIYAQDYTRAESLFNEAIEASIKIKNRWMEMGVHENMTRIPLSQGQYEEAAQYSRAILQRFQELDYRTGQASAKTLDMISAWAMEDYAQAGLLGREVIETYPEINDRRHLDYFYLGRIELAKGSIVQTEKLFLQATSLLAESGSYITNIFSEVILLGWATLFCKQGKLPEAARVLGAMNGLYQQTKYYFTPRERAEHEKTLAAVRTGLSDASFAGAWKDGQALNLEQAINAAMESTEE